MDSVVHLEHVSRRFGSVEAVRDVSFDVHRGEVFGLLGHNGAGKTTLLRLVNGLLPPTGGTIRTFDLDPGPDGHLVRRRTGVVTTYPGLDEYLSPAENVAVYAAIQGVPQDVLRTRGAHLLHQLGLDGVARSPARTLSAGMKQRVSLARALIHDPELLLLDEPTANLDPIAARQVRDMVRGYAIEGRTVLLSTHNLGEAEFLCDRVGILREGRLIALGSMDTLAKALPRHGLEVVVGASQADRAEKALRPLLNGHTLTADGDRLLATGIPTADAPHLVRALVANDVDVLQVAPVIPSLEDIYLAMHLAAGAQ